MMLSTRSLMLLLLSLPALASWSAAPAAVTFAGRRAASALMILLEPERDAALHVPKRTSRLLDTFLEQFHGHFDNHAQIVANEAAGLAPREGGGHEHIHCVLRHVPVRGADGPHVLATYYFNGRPEAVFRERLYAFDAVTADPQFGDCVRMAIYKLREPVTARLRAAGELEGYSADDVALTAECDLDDELLVPGADVYWRWCGERFEGEMRTDSITIVSERTGDEIVVRDDVALWEDALWVNDRGHDAASGDYVYGNIHGIPYKMARVQPDHWTATGKPDEPEA